MSSVLGAAQARLGVMRLGAVGAEAPPPEPQDVRVIFRRANPELSRPVKRGVVERFGAPNPPDQTPIMPPARRCERGDFFPPIGLEGVTRRTPPAPDFVATPPRLAVRRDCRLLPGPPPTSSEVRRSRPILSDIGPNLPVHRSRKSVGQVIPFSGKVRRSRLPSPGPEPVVLPPRRVAVRGHLGVHHLWIPPEPRALLLVGPTSPDLLAPCPYRPHAQDEAEAQGRAAGEDADSRRPRSDEADSFPVRIDECA